MTEPWLSADDIASHLGVTKDTVYTWIAEKGMPAHKIGRLCQRRPNIDPLSSLNFDPSRLMCCYLPAGCAGVLRSSRRARVR